MKWSNVGLIYIRELRDQMRDRRTLFTIAVLPLLLYPLLGMGYLQISQFRREHEAKVLVVGAETLPAEQQLLQGEKFSDELVADLGGAHLDVDLEADPGLTRKEMAEFSRTQISDNGYDLVVWFSPRDPIKADASNDDSATPKNVLPQPHMFVDRASDQSKIAEQRIDSVMRKWRSNVVASNLESIGAPTTAYTPFTVKRADVSHDSSRRAAFWSKILPFVVLVWALTGAFYPAVDLCAGEKERGTLETLLCSPAARSEIVLGKLLTVMTFSMATSLLNIVSMGFTGAFILSQMGGGLDAPVGGPPILAMGWLVLALIPISALFSALSLAIAAFARSSKEGQYYLMPLLMITLPLMILPMLPASQLDLGSGLIPVTGMMLLMRALMEGDYIQAISFGPVVVGVTSVCCFLAIRWAIDQFQNESVLFRESERWGVALWLRHLVRDREELPYAGEAILCGIIILVIRFFSAFLVGMPGTWGELASSTVITLMALVATPAVMMAIMLTRNRKKTLLIQMPSWGSIPAAVLLAMALHPAAMVLSEAIGWLYPVSDQVGGQLGKINLLIEGAPGFWAVLGVFALAPAICEELAFRGFILSGLRRMGHKWAAIFLSALFFGAAHGILQQSLSAFAVGIVLGFVAIHSRSIFPCIAFHFTYNALSMFLALQATSFMNNFAIGGLLFRRWGEGYTYQWYIVDIGALLAVGLLMWFRRQPVDSTEEEAMREALDQQRLQPASA